MTDTPAPAAKEPYKIDPDRVSKSDLSAILRVGEAAITTWVKRGCPKNEDETFVLYTVHKWLINRESKGGLVEQKLKADIERIKAQTEKISEQYILRTDHEQMMNAWASAFKKFWEQCVKRNALHFCNKELDQIQVLFDGFGRTLISQWADAGVEKKK